MITKKRTASEANINYKHITLKKFMMFKGEIKNNIPIEGKGKWTYNNGDYFEGEFKNENPYTGKGKLTFNNGDHFEGEFIKSEPYFGKGKWTYENGKCFEGIFNFGNCYS